MAIDFPELGPAGTTFTDGNGQTWISNGDAWVRTKLGSGIPEPSDDGNQYSRLRNPSETVGDWVRVAQDVWYLGGWPANPTTNNDGNPLSEGNVYYNTTTDIMMSWDGIEWRAFAPTLQVFGLQKYTYDFSAAAPTPDVPITGPDVYDNTPNGWLTDETVLTVYNGGQRMEQQVDPAILVGDYTVDYALSQITPLGTWVNDTVVFVVSKKDSDRYIAADDASVEGWDWVDQDMNAPVDHTKVVSKLGLKTYIDAEVQKAINASSVYVDSQFTGYKNVIINGAMDAYRKINNTSFNGNWGALNGQAPGYDRWTNGTPINGALTMVQYIDLSDIKRGLEYTLSWKGGGEGQFEGSAVGASPITAISDAGHTWSNSWAKLPVNATEIQLELGDRQTTFENRHLALEQTLVERHVQVINVHSYLEATVRGFRYVTIPFRTRMANVPTIQASGIFYGKAQFYQSYTHTDSFALFTEGTLGGPAIKWGFNGSVILRAEEW